MPKPVVIQIQTEDVTDFEVISRRIKTAMESPRKHAKGLAGDITQIEKDLQDAGTAAQRSMSAIEKKSNDARRESLKLDAQLKSLSAALARNNSLVASGTDAQKRGYAERNRAIRVEQGLLRARKATHDSTIKNLAQEKRELAAIIKDYRQLERVAKSSRSQGKGGFGGLIQGLKSTPLLADAAAMGIGVVAAGAARLGKEALTAAGKYNDLIRGLTFVEGSAEAAALRFDELNELAKLPSLDRNTLIQYNNSLSALGASKTEIDDVFIALSRGVSTFGGTMHDTNGILLQFSQAVGKGSLLLSDFRPIIERMPTFLVEANKALQTGETSWDAFKIAMEDSMDSGKSFFEAFQPVVNQLKNLPGGEIDSYSNSLGNLEDAFTNLQAAMGQKLIGSFVSVSNWMQKIIEQETKLWRYGKDADKFLDFIEAVGEESEIAAAKQQVLEKDIARVEKRLEQSKNQYKEYIEKGANPAAESMEQLDRKIKGQEAALARLNSQLPKTEEETKKATKAFEIKGKALDALSNAYENRVSPSIKVGTDAVGAQILAIQALAKHIGDLNKEYLKPLGEEVDALSNRFNNRVSPSVDKTTDAIGAQILTIQALAKHIGDLNKEYLKPLGEEVDALSNRFNNRVSPSVDKTTDAIGAQIAAFDALGVHISTLSYKQLQQEAQAYGENINDLIKEINRKEGAWEDVNTEVSDVANTISGMFDDASTALVDFLWDLEDADWDSALENFADSLKSIAEDSLKQGLSEGISAQLSEIAPDLGTGGGAGGGLSGAGTLITSILTNPAFLAIATTFLVGAIAYANRSENAVPLSEGLNRQGRPIREFRNRRRGESRENYESAKAAWEAEQGADADTGTRTATRAGGATTAGAGSGATAQTGKQRRGVLGFSGFNLPQMFSRQALARALAEATGADRQAVENIARAMYGDAAYDAEVAAATATDTPTDTSSPPMSTDPGSTGGGGTTPKRQKISRYDPQGKNAARNARDQARLNLRNASSYDDYETKRTAYISAINAYYDTIDAEITALNLTPRAERDRLKANQIDRDGAVGNAAALRNPFENEAEADIPAEAADDSDTTTETSSPPTKTASKSASTTTTSPAVDIYDPYAIEQLRNDRDTAKRALNSATSFDDFETKRQAWIRAINDYHTARKSRAKDTAKSSREAQIKVDGIEGDRIDAVGRAMGVENPFEQAETPIGTGAGAATTTDTATGTGGTGTSEKEAYDPFGINRTRRQMQRSRYEVGRATSSEDFVRKQLAYIQSINAYYDAAEARLDSLDISIEEWTNKNEALAWDREEAITKATEMENTFLETRVENEDKIAAAAEKAAEARRKAEEKLKDDIADIRQDKLDAEKKFREDIENLEEEHQEKLSDIEQKYLDKREDLDLSFQEKVKKTRREMEAEIAGLYKEFHAGEISREELIAGIDQAREARGQTLLEFGYQQQATARQLDIQEGRDVRDATTDFDRREEDIEQIFNATVATLETQLAPLLAQQTALAETQTTTATTASETAALDAATAKMFSPAVAAFDAGAMGLKSVNFEAFKAIPEVLTEKLPTQIGDALAALKPSEIEQLYAENLKITANYVTVNSEKVELTGNVNVEVASVEVNTPVQQSSPQVVVLGEDTISELRDGIIELQDEELSR